MVTQLDLFGRGLFEMPPYARGSTTSRAAAMHVVTKAPTQRTRILDFIRGCGRLGATRDEIEVSLGLPGNTVRPRVRELLKMHGIFVAPEATRKTRAGLAAEVLVAL